MSLSTLNIRKNIDIFEKEDSEPEENKKYERKQKKAISLVNDNYQKEIFKKLNGNCILGFIKNSERKNSVNTAISETEMNYDLCMINKFDENLNSSLSFISEFDLEEDKKELDSSFDSCQNDISVEQIDIKGKNIKIIQEEDEKEDDEDNKLEKEWNDIQELLLSKNLY